MPHNHSRGNQTELVKHEVVDGEQPHTAAVVADKSHLKQLKGSLAVLNALLEVNQREIV